MKKLLAFFFLICFFLSFPMCASADFGCHFIGNSRLATPIDDGTKKISYRFTCKDDMDLTAVSLFCDEAKTPPGYLVGIFPDKDGKPGDVSLGTAGFLPRGNDWVTIPIGHIPLFGGKTYHLVIYQDKNRGGTHPVGMIGPQNYASFCYTDFLNRLYPQDEAKAPQEDVLLFENGSWWALGRQPLYALHGNGFKVQGDPYESFGSVPVYGDISQGEALHPHCPIFPSGLLVRVKKQGNPSASLDYKVYTNDFLSHKTTFSFGGTAIQPGQVTDKFQWVTIGIKPEDHPKPFPSECTYVAFQTDSGQADSGDPGCKDCYLISEVGNGGGLPMAAEMSFDGGPHLSRAAYSTDGGKNWIDKFEWDANIVILGEPCPIPTPLSINPVLTPEPLPWGITR